MHCNTNKHRFNSTFFTNYNWKELMDEIVDNIATPPKSNPSARQEPQANFAKRGDQYELSIALPGYKKEDVQLSIDGHNLSIQIHSSTENEPTPYIKQEFDYSKAKRVFKLRNDIDPLSIEASMNHGILKIVLQKKAAFVAKSININ